MLRNGNPCGCLCVSFELAHLVLQFLCRAIHFQKSTPGTPTDLEEAVALEARLQEFVHGLMVQQHGKVSLEDLIGQQRFPDKLPDPGVTYKRVLQDYDPDPPFRAQRQRDHSGIRRTDYLLW